MSLVLTDPTDEQGLYEVVKDLSGQDSLSFKKFVALANLAKDDYSSLVIRNNQRWDLDDSTNLDFGIADATVNATETHVPLEDEVVSLKEVQWAGKVLTPVDISEAKPETLIEKYGATGTPVAYDYIGHSLFFYPVPDTTSTVTVYYSRPYTHFGVTDAGVDLGVIPIHEKYLVYHILDALTDKTNDPFSTKISNKLFAIEQSIIEFFGMQDNDTPKRMIPKVESNK